MTFDASATYSYFPSLFLSLDALYPDSHFHSFTCNNYLKFVSLDGFHPMTNSRDRQQCLQYYSQEPGCEVR